MPQSYANHTRWLAPYHFVVAPILLLHVLLSVRDAVQHPGWWPWWSVLVALAIAAAAGLARSQVLTVQDRLIRLEETLRLQRLLPETEHDEIARLSRKEIVALRFASDDELPALFRRVRAGEFADPKAIKQAIRNWRPDELRA